MSQLSKREVVLLCKKDFFPAQLFLSETIITFYSHLTIIC